MKLFLAMAYHQSHQPAQARTWLGEANVGKDADWEERLIYQRLRQEAAELLKIAEKPKG